MSRRLEWLGMSEVYLIFTGGLLVSQEENLAQRRRAQTPISAVCFSPAAHEHWICSLLPIGASTEHRAQRPTGSPVAVASVWVITWTHGHILDVPTDMSFMEQDAVLGYQDRN
ncbi:hypothetical protein SCP_0306300 [Sparassis crispa]|uniref:Uncharacterized protein n=1 Tax=Sparassis crispa TaxID=139825 RepID=A0A401GFH2_9APHY|nr:hypothetical protein SCP_0306300 [Sparassis crispa]GBE80909.1 hypothetical protein SCP_0306300 [Sparassis crispa]